MEKSRGKEIKLNIKNNYKTTYGSVDNKNPKAIFIRINAWGLPIDELELNYDNVIKKLDKRLRMFIYNNVDSNLFDKKRCIVDLDLRESGITFNKKSFMSCEVTLFQNNHYDLSSSLIINHLTELTTKIIEEELAKCDVVCANCHANRTYLRRKALG